MNSLATQEYYGWHMPALGSIQPAQDPSGEFVQPQGNGDSEGYHGNPWGSGYASGTALWSLEKKHPSSAVKPEQDFECQVCGGDVDEWYEEDCREYDEIQKEYSESIKMQKERAVGNNAVNRNRFAALASEDEPEDEEEEVADIKVEWKPTSRTRRWGNKVKKQAKKVDVLGKAQNFKGLCNLETSKYELVEITVDSGAEESVTPLNVLAQFPTRETENSKSGEQFVAANGSVIDNEGERKVEMHTLDGVKRSMVFQVTTVNKALASVARMNEKGNVVVFDGENSYIQNKESGEVIPMKKKQGSWVLEVWVEKDPSKAAGFARQEA